MSDSGPGTDLRGSMTALVTPFCHGKIDWDCLDALVERQIQAGTAWLVPCGTTGESPTLTEGEHEDVIGHVIARSAGRCPVLAGTGSNSTAETIRRTRRAAELGADAALLVAPYYNRPTQDGLFAHYAAAAESVDLPLVLYNVPVRTGVTIGNEVVARLRRAYPNVVAIKHATGSVDGVTGLLSSCDITVLSGDDVLTWPLMALGAVGVISVVSNLAPSLIRSATEAAGEGDLAKARKHHRSVHDLAVGLGQYGPNPLPIKTAMAMTGLLREEFRLPLCPLDAGARSGIERLLRRHELLQQAVA